MKYTKNLTNSKFRKQAEELWKNKLSETKESISESEAKKLIHESEVYQIELELQNEELKRAKEQTQKAFRDSELRFQSLLQSVPSVAIQGYSPDGIIHYWNDASRQLYQYSEEEAIGHSLFDLIIPPEIHDSLKQAIQQMQNTGKPIPAMEISLMRKDRSRIMVFTSHAIIHIPGYVIELFCFDFDLTEHKKSELEIRHINSFFASIIDNIPNPIFIKDAKDLKFILFNRAAEEMTGFSKNILLGKNDYDFVPKEQADFFTSKDRETLNGKLIVDIPEETIQTLHNGERILHTKKVPILNENGDPEFLLGISEDITDLKLVEKQLKQMVADKDRFISILAHDLSSPFNALLGFSDLLTNKISTYDVQTIEKYIGYINKTARRTFELLEDLLLWARAQSGKLPFQPQKLIFSHICHDVIESIKQIALHKNISINNFSIDKNIIFADKNMLKTVLRNMFLNAIKFTHSGGYVNVYTDYNETNVMITVSDNGVGMEPEILSSLFNISQIQSTPGTSEEKGTGLGLLICKEFIEKHNGKIWVESEPGKGTDFHFTIPNHVEDIK